jgi:hypothetical protein
MMGWWWPNKETRLEFSYYARVAGEVSGTALAHPKKEQSFSYLLFSFFLCFFYYKPVGNACLWWCRVHAQAAPNPPAGPVNNPESKDSAFGAPVPFATCGMPHARIRVDEPLSTSFHVSGCFDVR